LWQSFFFFKKCYEIRILFLNIEVFVHSYMRSYCAFSVVLRSSTVGLHKGLLCSCKITCIFACNIKYFYKMQTQYKSFRKLKRIIFLKEENEYIFIWKKWIYFDDLNIWKFYLIMYYKYLCCILCLSMKSY